jgi:hypothetical protein
MIQAKVAFLPRPTLSRTAELEPVRPPSLAVPSDSEGTFWTPFLLLFFAMSLNFMLCFINTNIADIASLHVILAETVIVLLALLLSMRVLDVHSSVLVGIFFLYLAILILVRAYLSPASEIDVKIIRDFLIPLVFFCWEYVIRTWKSPIGSLFASRL